jgi:hypothetical protein
MEAAHCTDRLCDYACGIARIASFDRHQHRKTLNLRGQRSHCPPTDEIEQGKKPELSWDRVEYASASPPAVSVAAAAWWTVVGRGGPWPPLWSLVWSRWCSGGGTGGCVVAWARALPIRQRLASASPSPISPVSTHLSKCHIPHAASGRLPPPQSLQPYL